MKKNLIALAVFGAFSGAALAQSNVTLYGIIDVNFQYNDPSCSGPAACSSTRGINPGHQSGSRFGLRGVEALSPGLNAVFVLEGGINNDLGTSGQSGQLFGRQAWAGLSGGWGTLVAGRIPTFSSGTGDFDMFGPVDPFGTGFGDSGMQSTFTSAGALRLDNNVLYQSPTFGGFKFGAGYSFNAFGAEGAGSGNNNRVMYFGANYTGGPFFAAITYDVIDLNDSGFAGSATVPAIFPGASDQKHLQIGGTFDLKFLKLHAGYAKEDNVYISAASGLPLQVDTGGDADSWMVGISAPLLGGRILASYQDRSGDATTACFGTFVPATNGCSVGLQTLQRDRDVWAIGYTYPFSRRTNLYVNFSDSDEEVTNRAAPTALVPNPPTTQVARPGQDRKQYTIGVRHLF